MADDHPQLKNTAEQHTPALNFQATSLMASLTVREIEKSVAWYRDVLGFLVQQRMERDGVLQSVRLVAGTVRILLNQDDGARGRDRRTAEGFSLTFTTSQSVDEVARRVREHGGTLDTEPANMPWGARMFRLHDPDGFKLSISAPVAG